jgi:hypothetical protein
LPELGDANSQNCSSRPDLLNAAVACRCSVHGCARIFATRNLSRTWNGKSPSRKSTSETARDLFRSVSSCLIPTRVRGPFLQLTLAARVAMHTSTIFAYDRAMGVSINVQAVHARKLAAVRREVAPGGVSSAWKPALDKVWELVHSQPDCGPTATTFFCINIRQHRAPQCCATSVSRSRAHLNPRARCTRPNTRRRSRRGHPPRPLQSYARDARCDYRMDGGESKGVRRIFVGDLRRPHARSGRH